MHKGARSGRGCRGRDSTSGWRGGASVGFSDMGSMFRPSSHTVPRLPVSPSAALPPRLDRPIWVSVAPACLLTPVSCTEISITAKQITDVGQAGGADLMGFLVASDDSFPGQPCLPSTDAHCPHRRHPVFLSQTSLSPWQLASTLEPLFSPN